MTEQALRRARHQSGRGKAGQRKKQHRARTHAVLQKDRQRLPHARLLIVHRYQKDLLVIAETKLSNQPR